MISIIMPTLWKGEYYKRMLPILNDHELVAEIIIINNDVNSTDTEILKLSKVRHLPQQTNIYVNPAWNLGVEESTQDVICLYSDDVLFDIKCLEMIYEKCKPENGMVGFSLETISEKSDDLNFLSSQLASWETMQVTPCTFMHYRFGICLFMHKNAYFKIPEEYKIYYGDTHLFDQNVLNGRQNYKVDACAVATKMKSTTKLFNEVVESDKKLFQSNSSIDAMMASMMENILKESQS
jgi:glycosyltransferase involved in cell wall biosynthesis